MPDESVLAPGTVLDDKFSIVRCIGRGGMGAVYEIQHTLTRHRRALKLLHPHYLKQPEAVDRFLQEAAAAGTIGNPHIAETVDAGRLASGEPYLLMELLSGRSLSSWLEAGQRIPLDLTLTILSQACRGIHAAHEAGIIHRDLKPENLFVTRLRDSVFVKILDFGVSKFTDAITTSRATRDGAFLGTLYYVAPEQFLNSKAVDRRADIYALGVILFECATGEHPYPLDTIAEVANKFMLEAIPAASSLCPALPEQLDAIIARAVEKVPEARYPDGLAMARDLEALRGPKAVTLPLGSYWASSLDKLDEARHQMATDVAGATLLRQLDQTAGEPPASAGRRAEGDQAALPSTRAGGTSQEAQSQRAQVEPGQPPSRRHGAQAAAVDPAESITPLTAPRLDSAQRRQQLPRRPLLLVGAMAAAASVGVAAALLGGGDADSDPTRGSSTPSASAQPAPVVSSAAPVAPVAPSANASASTSAEAVTATASATAIATASVATSSPSHAASLHTLPPRPPASTPAPVPTAPDHAGVGEFPQ